MKAFLKKVGASLLAALTTPEAVKAEKTVAVIVLARLAITIPAYAWVFDHFIRVIG